MKIKILISLLIISIFCNVYSICFILGKGITINNSYHQEQYQQQWSGQLLINQWNTQGDQIEWKTIESDYTHLNSDLKKLHPISSMYAKIIKFDSKIEIYYPDIFIKTKEVQK